MNRITTFITAAALAATTATAAFAGPVQIGMGIQFNNQQLQQQRTGLAIQFQSPQIRDALRTTCPDLNIETAQRANADGTIAVTIRVANHSGVDFVSNPGQQALVVNGRNGGNSATAPFTMLRNGQSVVWTDTFHPFEFPATYEARVSYDPDILLDGNPQNDDCRSSNNYGELTTAR